MGKLGAQVHAAIASQPAAPATNAGNIDSNAQSSKVDTSTKLVTETGKVEAKPELKPWETMKHKIKVNDAEQELSYTELLERAQKGMGADTRFQEAAAMRKQAEQALKLLKTDPTQAFKLLDVDPKSWAAKYLEEAAYEAMLSPEQKAQRDEKNSLMAQARELEALKKEKTDAATAKVREQIEQQLSQQVISALDTSGLPKTKEVVKRIAQKMITWREAGYKQVTPADVIADVKQEYQDDLKAMLGGAGEDQLEAFLGDETVKKLINKRNKTIQDKNSPFKAAAKNPTKKSSGKAAEVPKPMKGADWRRSLVEKWSKK